MSKIQFPVQPELKLASDLKYGKYKLLQGVVPSEVEGEGILTAALIDESKAIGTPLFVILEEIESHPSVFARIKTGDLDEANSWFDAIATYKA
jgi:hypothetical protein